MILKHYDILHDNFLIDDDFDERYFHYLFYEWWFWWLIRLLIFTLDEWWFLCMIMMINVFDDFYDWRIKQLMFLMIILDYNCQFWCSTILMIMILMTSNRLLITHEFWLIILMNDDFYDWWFWRLMIMIDVKQNFIMYYKITQNNLKLFIYFIYFCIYQT